MTLITLFALFADDVRVLSTNKVIFILTYTILNIKFLFKILN